MYSAAARAAKPATKPLSKSAPFAQIRSSRSSAQGATGGAAKPLPLKQLAGDRSSLLRGAQRQAAGASYFARTLASPAESGAQGSATGPTQSSQRPRVWWWWGRWDQHAENHVYGAQPGPTQPLSKLSYAERFLKWGIGKFEAETRNQSIQGWRNFLWNDQARWVQQRADGLRNFVDTVTDITDEEKSMSVQEWWDRTRLDWEHQFKDELREQFKAERKKWQFTDFEEWLNKLWIELKVYIGFSAGFFLGEWLLKRSLNNKLGENNIRNIQGLFEPDGIWNAATSLKDSKNVVILTGFSVAENMPETDGPPGAAAMAYAHYRAGACVTLVADRANMPIVKACVEKLDPGLAQHVRYRVVDLSHDFNGDIEAAQLLDELEPDAIIAIELPGRNHEGDLLNMRGQSVRPFNAALYKVVEEANSRGIPTAGVGDGGNEAGVLGATDIAGGANKVVPPALNGEEMKSVVASKYPMTAWNSNLGGFAYAALMLKMLGQEDRFITGQQVKDMNMAALDAGAVDGVTRKGKAGEPSDTDARFVTGTDGYEAAHHAADVDELNAELRDADLYKRGLLKAEGARPSAFSMFQFIDKWNAILATFRRWVLKRATKEGIEAAFLFVTTRAPTEDTRPTITIALCDSSHGLLVGAKNKLIEELRKRYPQYNLKFIGVGDHKKAPYGQYTPEELCKLDNKMLHAAQQAGADVALMVCNTASTVLKLAAALLGIRIPVVNLVYETSKGIAAAGGEHPTIISTQATADSDSYKDTVAQVSGGKIAVRPVDRIGAPTWAPIVNAAEHLDPAQSAKVQQRVDEVADKIPQDSTGVYLCCTHYPELAPNLRESLDARGREDVKVVDPMEFLVNGAVEEIDRLPKVLLANKIGLPPGPGRHDPNFTLLSSGTDDQVVESAIELTHTKIPPKNMQFVTGLSFGSDPDARLEYLRSVDFEGTQYDHLSRFNPATPSHVRPPLASPLHQPHPKTEADIQAEIEYGDFGGGAGEASWFPRAGEPDFWNPWNSDAAKASILDDIEAGATLEAVVRRHGVSRHVLNQMLASGDLAAARQRHQNVEDARGDARMRAEQVASANAVEQVSAQWEQIAARIRVARIVLGSQADAVAGAGQGASLEKLMAEEQALQTLVAARDAQTFDRISPVRDAAEAPFRK